MDDLALTVRAARLETPPTWRAYRDLARYLSSRSVDGDALFDDVEGTDALLSTIRHQRREAVLVAESAQLVSSAWRARSSRDRALEYDGEVFTLYVDPAYFGRGAGRATREAFGMLRKRGHTSCVIWAHAANNARFFYETMGGRVVAERRARLMGDLVPEIAFGWKTLALTERSHAK
jgi:ribosomal protein S18 acetylase RimI-like enzyme